MLKTDTINELIGVDDSWKAPEHIENTLEEVFDERTIKSIKQRSSFK